ncbi:hypothetical protein HDU86_005188 [Geranomyces michiganensis]|nr:hypothetical protein HDU86_005188 [Geranomyces michiganensis]
MRTKTQKRFATTLRALRTHRELFEKLSRSRSAITAPPDDPPLLGLTASKKRMGSPLPIPPIAPAAEGEEEDDRRTEPPETPQPSDGMDELTEYIHALHARKPLYLEAGLLYWGIIDTEDTKAFAMITKNAGQSIVDIANRIKGALKLTPYARTVFNTAKGKGLEDVPSIRAIVDSIRKRGTPGFWELMGGGSEATDEICEDEDVWYLMRCFVAMERYLDNYAGHKNLTERTFDWHAVHEFTTVAEFEHAVGESSELEGKPGFKHVRENYVDLPKVARSQLMCLREQAPDAQDLAVPYFHVYGRKVGFYILFAVGVDFYATDRIGTVALPSKDGDTIEVLAMCYHFFLLREVIERSAQKIDQRKRFAFELPVTTVPVKTASLLKNVVSPQKEAAREPKGKGRGKVAD